MALFSRIFSMCLRPQTPTGDTPGHRWGISVPQTPSFVPLSKFLATPLMMMIVHTTGLTSSVRADYCHVRRPDNRLSVYVKFERRLIVMP